MRKSLLRYLLTSYLLINGSFSWGAVFQEAVDGNPQKYKTHFLFSNPLSSPVNEVSRLNIPQPSLSVGEPDSIVQQSVSQPQPNTFSSPDSVGAQTMSARYERATLESVSRILSVYKSIPGGVTLEGEGLGLPQISKVSYDSEKNVLVLNENLVYQNPLSKSDMKGVLTAIQANDLMGVSLGDKDIIYGALAEGSLPSIYLKLADHFLGCITFANNRWVAMHSFPGGFHPRPYFGAGDYYAVYFNFKDFNFSVKDGKLEPAGSQLVATLIPLTGQKDGFGGYMPDFAKIAGGVFPVEFEGNISHIVANISSYQNESRLQKVDRYGQAAAFARALKKQGVNLVDVADKM